MPTSTVPSLPASRPDESPRSYGRPRNVAAAVAGWSARHRATAVTGWLLFVIAATAGSLTSMKELGFGLAVTVLIDATIVRAVLLPAVMVLLGDHNWSLPSWLNGLPRRSPGEVARTTYGRPEHVAEPAQ